VPRPTLRTSRGLADASCASSATRSTSASVRTSVHQGRPRGATSGLGESDQAEPRSARSPVAPQGRAHSQRPAAEADVDHHVTRRANRGAAIASLRRARSTSGRSGERCVSRAVVRTVSIKRVTPAAVERSSMKLQRRPCPPARRTSSPRRWSSIRRMSHERPGVERPITLAETRLRCAAGQPIWLGRPALGQVRAKAGATGQGASCRQRGSACRSSGRRGGSVTREGPDPAYENRRASAGGPSRDRLGA
jgi:hypothetical protein